MYVIDDFLQIKYKNKNQPCRKMSIKGMSNFRRNTRDHLVCEKVDIFISNQGKADEDKKVTFCSIRSAQF